MTEVFCLEHGNHLWHVESKERSVLSNKKKRDKKDDNEPEQHLVRCIKDRHYNRRNYFFFGLPILQFKISTKDNISTAINRPAKKNYLR